MDQLRFLLGDYPVTRPFIETPRLADGTVVKMHGFAENGGARPSMARMIRAMPGLEYDICELPLVNYFSAKELGATYTAIPVIVCRRFEHGGIWGDASQGVTKPKDLEGKRVGLIYHGHSDLVWKRGILSDQHGVDLDTITWITGNPETIPDAPLPPNVWQMPACSYAALMANRVAQGAVMPYTESFESPVRQLIPDVPAAEREWYERTGIFPPVHTVVVKDSVLAARPGLATELYHALTASKKTAEERWGAKGVPEDQRAAALSSGFLSPQERKARPYLRADHMPNGLEANRRALEMLVRFCREQKVTATEPPLEKLFVAVDERGVS